MFSILDIIRRDSATYYDVGSNRHTGRFTTLAVIAGLSLGMGSMVKTASNDFLSAALSAEAILVGFSFNVLFYLVANRLSRPGKYASIEHELRFERLSKLSDEIFDNVTYFNLVAISAAMAALALLLTGSPNFITNLNGVGDFVHKHAQIDRYFLNAVSSLSQIFGLSVLIFLIIESLYTFLRAVGRVRFYFGMLKTMNDDSPSP